MKLSNKIEIVDVKKGHFHMNEAQLKVVKDMRDMGIGYRQISQVIGCTQQAIKYHLSMMTKTRQRLRYVLNRKKKKKKGILGNK